MSPQRRRKVSWRVVVGDEGKQLSCTIGTNGAGDVVLLFSRSTDLFSVRPETAREFARLLLEAANGASGE